MSETSLLYGTTATWDHPSAKRVRGFASTARPNPYPWRACACVYSFAFTGFPYGSMAPTPISDGPGKQRGKNRIKKAIFIYRNWELGPTSSPEQNQRGREKGNPTDGAILRNLMIPPPESVLNGASYVISHFIRFT